MQPGRPVLTPAASVALRDAHGRLLLVRRAEDGTWCLPGGRMEPGETWAQCAVRECLEETGIEVRLTGLIGIYSDPSTQLHTYPDGLFAQFLTAVFSAERLADRPGAVVDPGEIVDQGWFGEDDPPEAVMATDAPLIADVFARGVNPLPVIG
jgi:8-oxo-dGTP pyrophosphatase MutT (NUDIX family)